MYDDGGAAPPRLPDRAEEEQLYDDGQVAPAAVDNGANTYDDASAARSRPLPPEPEEEEEEEAYASVDDYPNLGKLHMSCCAL